MGQSYPSGPEFFNQRLHKAFVSRKDVQDPKEIKALIDKGNYVIKELEALHKLRKYRAMKHAYYDETPPPPSTVPERWSRWKSICVTLMYIQV